MFSPTLKLESTQVAKSEWPSWIWMLWVIDTPKCHNSWLIFSWQTQVAGEDISLPFSFSTSTSSMVSKYWLQGRGEKSLFRPGLYFKREGGKKKKKKDKQNVN